ncbi:class I SAM-dependent DNA methyltransferase [Methylobacterium marchantiae]|uniref:Class I SAM-dependent DNA methyltransferase n=1 Tax=Methylobacterium marchantiae TaxID=600331 RepID=A0ABW3X2F7_9HYPH|nr:Ubiquinone biosynthesis O-methyltransferase, mitochondrial [Methylobacterium marchantiae]
MTRHSQTMPPDYFEDRYAGDPDPWQFTTSPYEAGKYAATLEALPKSHYASALEIGCSIGIFTEALAPRCDALISVDTAEKALEQARERCEAVPQVRFERLHVPDGWPEGRFDLILMSEVIYFLDPDDMARLAERILETLRPDGDLVLVHWTGPTHYPQSGDEASDMLIGILDGSIRIVHHHRTDRYRLDVLTRIA